MQDSAGIINAFRQCIDYDSLRFPETSIFKWSGYKLNYRRKIGKNY